VHNKFLTLRCEQGWQSASFATAIVFLFRSRSGEWYGIAVWKTQIETLLKINLNQ
jgi:hypothetical protein